MLILSSAMIRIRTRGRQKAVTVEGAWKRHEVRIRQFFLDQSLASGTVRLRFGRMVFSQEFNESLAQRTRNFLVNRCPVKD